jgi:hypothetical protein
MVELKILQIDNHIQYDPEGANGSVSLNMVSLIKQGYHLLLTTTALRLTPWCPGN